MERVRDIASKHGLRCILNAVEAAGQITPLHEHIEVNEQRFLDFVRLGEYDVFLDYPVRILFRQLHDEFPDAAFILTVRASPEDWFAGLRPYLSENAPHQDALVDAHQRLDDDIRALFRSGARNFLELNTDMDDGGNERELLDFLRLRPSEASAFAPVPLSRRGAPGKQLDLMSVGTQLAGSKALLGEQGWIFLANDTNDFLSVLYGRQSWSATERVKAAGVIRQRMADVRPLGSTYRKFIVPEKSAVYPEYLPYGLGNPPHEARRPSEMLAEDSGGAVSYLLPWLMDAKSYGLLYFRGDTHTNWHGAFLVYRYIAESLVKMGLVQAEHLIKFADLTPEIAQYDGDLYTQLLPTLREEHQAARGFMDGRWGFECVMKYGLSEERRLARRAAVPEDYSRCFTKREVLVYEAAAPDLPRAVIFRDSTLDLCHELIAQHFSRSVFIWHQGQVYGEVIEQERPDIVLHVMAERFVISYPEWPPLAPMPEPEPN